MTLPAHAKKHTLGTWIRWIVLPLLLGAATMALIAKTETKQWEINVAATFTNLARDLMVVDAQQQSLRLRVSATPSSFKALESTRATCRFDLSGLGEGNHTIAVQSAGISLPKGVSLLAAVTPTLTIRLETMSSKTVDVLAMLEGAVAPGFSVAAVRLKPDRIRLTGTMAMLAPIDTVKTRAINLEGASESFKKEVPLNLPEAIIVDPPSRIVVAEIDIRERLITRVLENIPVVPKGTTAGHRIAPEGIALTISGPEVIVSKIESDPTFSVTIDLEGLAPGSYSLKAAIKLPVRTTLVQVTPELFSVTIGN
jgi:YbbR domain-containing protein